MLPPEANELAKMARDAERYNVWKRLVLEKMDLGADDYGYEAEALGKYLDELATWYERFDSGALNKSAHAPIAAHCAMGGGAPIQSRPRDPDAVDCPIHGPQETKDCPLC